MSEQLTSMKSEACMIWESISLGEIITISKGKKQTPSVDGVNRYINIENLHDAENSLFTDDSGVLVKKQDLIIAWDGANAGKVGVGFDGVIGSTLARLTVNIETVFPKFLFWVLESLNPTIKSHRTGATIPHVNSAALKELQIPLPPLPIQKHIAGILDAADALRRKDQELLKKYDELAQAVFIDMFGDPVRNDKGWEMKAVIEYCDCIVPGRDKPKSFTGLIPWVTTDDLNHLDITIISKKSIGLTKQEIEQVRAKVIPANSVIMTCVGDLGIVSINAQEIVINQQLHAFQCSNKIDPYFLMYNLSKQKDFMYKMSSSTTVPYMNKTVCNSIPVICPPMKLQNLFSQKLEFIRKQLAIIKNNPAESLFNSLIQKAFKGELSYVNKEQL